MQAAHWQIVHWGARFAWLLPSRLWWVPLLPSKSCCSLGHQVAYLDSFIGRERFWGHSYHPVIQEKPQKTPPRFRANIWVFPKIGVPQNGWFIVENPIKMDDLGGFPPIFGSTPIWIFTVLPGGFSPRQWWIFAFACGQSSCQLLSLRWLDQHHELERRLRRQLAAGCGCLKKWPEFFLKIKTQWKDGGCWCLFDPSCRVCCCVFNSS